MPPGWNDHLHNGAGMGIRQSETTSKLVDALPHPADANANAVRTQLNHLLLNSFAIVTHSHNDSTFALDQAHAPVARSGMPEHVGQRFLDDAEDLRFRYPA